MISGCAGPLLLCGLFSSCREWGATVYPGVRAAHCRAPMGVEHGHQGVWAQELQHEGSAAAALGSRAQAQ